MSENPLLTNSTLPLFSQIRAEHVVPAIKQRLDECRQTVDAVIRAHADKAPTWDSFVEPLDLAEDALERSWSPVGHLNSVMNSEALREAYDQCLPLLSEYATEMGQHEGLFKLTQALVDSKEFEGYSQAQKRSLENSLRGFRLSGIALDKDKQQRFKAIEQSLSELSSKFEQNLLDATNDWSMLIEDPDQLSGLPESALGLMAQSAKAEDKSGWLLTLQPPCYIAVMTYADNRELRETLYRAFNTRASSLEKNGGERDNAPIIDQILALRHEKAQLLGFANYAEYSLDTKMAESPDEVSEFLEQLVTKSRPQAQNEFEALQSFASEQGQSSLKAWDVPYWSEKRQQAEYQLDQEALKPWFPAMNVIQGLFDVVERLYGLHIREQQGVSVWHDDVTFYDIVDGEGQKRGQFYLDLYARKDKRGGAWMDVCSSRYKKPNGLQYPVAYLTCNATPAIEGKPALLTHDEVITLFHEFGHGLHHMLTQVDVPGVSGISGVEWDAVELPSQFMENWCWEREALDLFARHYETNEPLPEAQYQRMIAAKNFQSAMMMVRQLEFSLFDFYLHRDYQVGETDVQSVLDEVRQRVAVVQPPSDNRFQNGFSHIFAGGYAAGYYSYKWAEVLSADAYSRFEEEGIFNRDTGRDFLHHVLEQGGAVSAKDLFVAFRGREPSIDPLLRHSGLAA
ncbi:oligopeptidase A [gamma proteobacterium HTCC5015]|nr:oligopeptidase A [gamma proteobacterium HTCC5015]